VTLPSDVLSTLAASLGSDVPFFQAGCGAVVTGRGEQVEALPNLGEPVAILLVTPRLSVSTAAVFRAYVNGYRPVGDSALRISEELASDLRRGSTPVVLLDRARDLAIANDLIPAAVATAPGLAGFTSALAKLLDRPVCQSGSGPSLWILYSSLDEARRAGRTVRQAVDSGTLPVIGEGEPFVAATLIATRAEDVESRPQPPGGLPHVGGPRTVHNWPNGKSRGSDSSDGPHRSS
jgi:4-diphosphocytidyl-2C-methyl-D-erythritol kinase